MNDQYKFFSIFSALDHEEVKAFKKYVQHEHGGELTTLRIFAFYQKFHPDFDKAPEIQKAHRRIFKTDEWWPDKQGKKMLNAFHDLSLWLKTFLLRQKVSQMDSLLTKNIWLQILWERSLKGEFSLRAADLGKQFVEQKAGDFFTVAEQIKSGLLHNLYLAETQQTGNTIALEQDLKRIMAQCDLIKLKMECEWLNVRKIWPQNHYDSGVALSTEPGSGSTLILQTIYKAIRNLLETDDEVHYYEVLSLMNATERQIEAVERYDIYQHLRNFASNKIKGGEKNWIEKSHQMNKKSFKDELYAKNITIQPTTFANVVNIACAVRDFAWASDFVAKQGPLVPDLMRRESILMANAIIAYEQRRYDEVIVLLNQHHFKDFFHEIRAKVLLLKSHYETNAPENNLVFLRNLCANFVAYLNRHKKKRDANVFEPAMAFAKAFEILILQRKTRKELLEAINNWPKMYSREWLLEKVNAYSPLK